MKLVYGYGHNDIGSKGNEKAYERWTTMLKRCYCPKVKGRSPTYEGCTVCPDWLVFGKFKVWMEKQDWCGKELDKDLLVQGNKLYGPDTCIFISRQVNSFLLDSRAARGDLPIGVSYVQMSGKYVARIKELGQGRKHLGTFDTPEQAHSAWLSRKRELAIELAKRQNDVRVADALLRIKFENF